MLSMQRIRDDPDSVRDGARRKGESAPIDELLAVDADARALRTEVEQARAEQRFASAAVRGKPRPWAATVSSGGRFTPTGSSPG